MAYFKIRIDRSPEGVKAQRKLALIMILCFIALIVGSTLYKKYIDEAPKMEHPETKGWQVVNYKDVFGDNIDKHYTMQQFVMQLPSGTRGGTLDAQFIIRNDVVTPYAIVVSPTTNGRPSEDYGTYMKLWYKEEGGRASKEMILLEFSPQYGYVIPKSFEGKIRDWCSQQKTVKFKGFTNDNPHAAKFEYSPNGIGREGADVYLDPEFVINF